jgi:N-acyl amino acid synthase of PEP-CTERM/exosortase system
MSAPYRPVTLDDSEQLLEMSYRLRYQTYCLERLFFSKDEYPSELESDAFDSASVHVGVLDAKNELVGTARVVAPSSAGLPLLQHCTLFPDETALSDTTNIVVELSRACIIRRRSRRQEDEPTSPQEGRARAGSPASARELYQESNEISAALIKAMYQATKRLHATHWIIAVEKGLRRRLSRFGLPFRLAGPEADYYGPVSPYVLSLAELDDVILARQHALLNDFLVGLEPTYWPSPICSTGA